jgi:hypothetical protein
MNKTKKQLALLLPYRRSIFFLILNTDAENPIPAQLESLYIHMITNRDKHFMFFYYLLKDYNQVNTDVQFHSPALASSESTLPYKPEPNKD